MPDHSGQIAAVMAAMQEAQACQSAALEAVTRLKELDPDADGPLAAAVAHFREVRVQAYWAAEDLKLRLPPAVIESIEGPQCVACGEA